MIWRLETQSLMNPHDTWKVIILMMLNTSTRVYVLALTALLMASCSVQKRYHNKGWNIQTGLFKKGERTATAAKPDAGTSLNVELSIPEKSQRNLEHAQKAVPKEAHALFDFKSLPGDRKEAIPAGASAGLLRLHKGLRSLQKADFSQMEPSKHMLLPYGKDASTKASKNQVRPTDNPQPDERPTVHWAATTALVFSILGIVPFYGILFGALAIILSIIALISMKMHPGKYLGKGMAIAAIVIGALTAAGWIAIIATLHLF